MQQEPHAGALYGQTRDRQREWLIKHTNLPSLELIDFGFTETKSRVPVVTETMTLTVRRWVSPSGMRLFLSLNLLSATGNAPVLTKPRQLPVVLNYNYEDTDMATYTLPAGYVPEFTLSPVVINSKFGSYNAHAGLVGDQLLSVGRLRMRRGRYPAEACAEYADFRRKVAKANWTQLVLIRKEAVTPLLKQTAGYAPSHKKGRSLQGAAFFCG